MIFHLCFLPPFDNDAAVTTAGFEPVPEHGKYQPGAY
jgi:hypothetical protein